VYGFKVKVRLEIKKKIINYKEFIEASNDKDRKNIVVDFCSRYKIKCNSRDLSAIAETGVLEDYQKLDSFKIKSGDVIFDVGAHIGSFSVYAANKGATVYAFEPNKDNYERLLENIRINNYESKIKAYNYGIYNKEGEVGFSVHNQNSGGHSIDGGSEIIKVRKLENILIDENIVKVNMLKIDVEGSEYEIFPSITENTYNKIEKIVGEYHTSYDKPEWNFKRIEKILTPHYRSVKYKSPYYFYAQK
jgi:FkbM family methyltransferase